MIQSRCLTKHCGISRTSPSLQKYCSMIRTTSRILSLHISRILKIQLFHKSFKFGLQTMEPNFRKSMIVWNCTRLFKIWTRELKLNLMKALIFLILRKRLKLHRSCKSILKHSRTLFQLMKQLKNLTSTNLLIRFVKLTRQKNNNRQITIPKTEWHPRKGNLIRWAIQINIKWEIRTPLQALGMTKHLLSLCS